VANRERRCTTPPRDVREAEQLLEALERVTPGNGWQAREPRKSHLTSGFTLGSLVEVEPRAVAQFGRAPVSKTGGRGFESLPPC
jgi:hypothetical protein